MRIKNTIIERRFAVLFSQHRHWGTIITPYIIVKEEINEYYRPEECLSPFASPDTTIRLEEEENEIIQLCNAFSDRNLFRLFSREKNVVDFLDKVDENRFEKHIKPFIEDKLYKCLKLTVKNNIPIYRQKTKSVNLHPEDLIIPEAKHAIPVFCFSHRNDFSSYKLELELGDNKLDLRDKDIELISNEPSLIRYKDSLIFIDSLEGKKLIPFFKKDKVLIPGHLNKKYFSGFVLNIVNKNRVIPDGFEIREHKAERSARIYLEHGIKNIPTLILKFKYEDIEIYSSSTEISYTKLDINSESYIYRKFKRDFEWEKSVVDLLFKLGFYSDDNINFTTTNLSHDKNKEIYSLVEAVNDNYHGLTEAGIEILSGSVDNNYYLEEFSLNIDYQADNDWFDLKAYVLIEDIKIPFTQLRRHILNDNREYQLPNGKILIIPEEWFDKYRSLFELGQSSEDSLKIHKQHFSLLNEAFDTKECTSCPGLERLVLPESIPDVLPPDGLNIEMRAYQQEGLNWMLFLQNNNLGGCLADDMGLGKTLQTLSLLQYNKENPTVSEDKTPPKISEPVLFNDNITKCSLLIVPASLVHNWSNEIRKFTPELKQYSYIGSNRNKNIEYFNNYDIVLSSYHTVRQDINILSEFKFFYTVLDESQVIKNPASQLYKTIVRIKSDYRLVLTGTPVENSLTDLWTQLNFVNPGILGNINYFKREFTQPIEKQNSEDKELKLNKLIRPFILRRTKSDVEKDLPAVTEHTVWCNMTEEQNRLYDEEKNSIRNTILNDIEKTASDKSAVIILQSLMKLRQLSNHPKLTDIDYSASAGKFDTVMEDIRSVSAEGHKILVFSSFVKHLKLFAKEFDREERKYSILTGSSNNREKIVKEFQSDPANNIFLISLKAGGVGLNLTAADYVFILDPWWNPAAESQALNRAHRIGQDKNVFVYKYITSGSIEEKIIKLQEKKSRLAETFISSNNPLLDLDVKEMIKLIG